MAKKNTTEANVVVTLNGEAARNELKRIKAEIEGYEQAAAQAYKQLDNALGDKMTKKAEELKKQFKVATKEVKDFSEMMKSLNSKSLNELKSAASQLKKQISQLAPGTKEFIDKSKQLQQVNSRIKSLEASFKAVVTEEKRATLSLKGLADGFNKYFGMVTAGTASITGLSMAFRKSAEEAAKLDDVYSDVMKTTGLLHEEVEGLDEELMKIDTRTSREQLLLLARDAGKLGIQGKDNILGFVRAADQIQVALGEDLGEGAIKELGKIADVFGLTKEMGIEKSLLSIASAVNALGQDSTAAEAYLVEFTQRLAGVGAMAGISVQNLLGFASGLDQSSMKVEMAATAFQKFLMKMYEDTATFAEYAGMQVEEFSDLLQNDANTAITTVLSTLNGKGGFNDLVPMFDQMGLDGARAVQVLSAMAKNLQAVTDAQALANVEFEKATSVTEEYNTKNNNLQAQLEKARKEFKNASIQLGQSLNPIMLKSTKLTTYLVKALATYGKEIKAVIIALAALTVVVKAQAIAEGVRALALKVSNTLSATGTVLSNKLLAAYYRLTGQTLKMAAAQKAANAAMSSSVIGAIAVAVAALTFAIARYVNKLKEANQELTYTEQLEKRIGEEQNKETARVIALTKIVNDQNVAYNKRKEALEELKKIVPDYHASLTKEGKLINNNKIAIDKYIESLKQATRMKILEEDFTDIQEKLMNAEDEYKQAMKELSDAMSQPAPLSPAAHAVYEQNINNLGKAARDAKKNLEDLQKKEQELMGKIGTSSAAEGATATLNTDDIVGNGGDSGNGGNGGNGNSYNIANKTIDKQIDLQKQIRERIAEELELAKYEQEWQDRFDYSDRLNDPSIADPKANEEFWDKIYGQRDKIVAQLEDQSLSKEYETEMMWLEKLHQNKLLSEETYEKLVFKTKVKYLEKYTEQTSQITNQAESMMTALQDAALAREEATYQARLTAAGDNAEEREKIEAEHEKKKLDIQKRYADVDMVINIAKTIAAGALAVMQAFAQLGPVAGAVMAAFIGITTGAQVATIIAQRNAIKNASVNSSGSSASTNTGKRTLTGYAEGGYTEDHTTLTTVGEKGTEYVIPHWMVRKNPVMVANLERYRRSGSHGRSGSVSRGFADGGFTSPTSSASLPSMDVSNVDWQAMREFNSIMRYCAENGLFVKYGDIMMAKKKHDTFKNQTTR